MSCPGQELNPCIQNASPTLYQKCYHHHHHHFWPSPLWVRSATCNQQPLERAIDSEPYWLLQSMWDCGTQGVLGLTSSSATGRSLPIFWRECSYDRLSISTDIQSCNVSKQRETPCLNSRGKACLPHFSIGNKFVRYHLMPNSLCRHHCAKASSLRPSTLVIAQHSEPYSKIGSTHVRQPCWNI